MKTLSFLPQKLLGSIFAVFVIFNFSSCEGRQEADNDAATMDYTATPVREEAAQSKSGVSQSKPQFEQKIIKNANLRFQVSDYHKSLNAIQNLVKSHQGFVVSSNEARVDNSLENNFIIRVPSKHLDALVNKLTEQSIYLD